MTSGYTTDQLASRAAAKARFKEKNPHYHRDYGRAQRAAEVAALPPLGSEGLTLFFAYHLIKLSTTAARYDLRQREWNKNNAEKKKAASKLYREQLTAETKNGKSREWAKLHPEESKAIKGRYRDSHRAKIQTQSKEYRKKNREKILAREKKRRAERYGSDTNYKIVNVLRARLRVALEGKSKAHNTLSLLGCSIEFLREHLEKQFLPGMTWENHSKHGWHIDHIHPCASFDLTDPAQQRTCFHFSNLQPLFATENLSKGDKIL